MKSVQLLTTCRLVQLGRHRFLVFLGKSTPHAVSATGVVKLNLRIANVGGILAKGSVTVGSLAAKAKVDIEQALVALWGEGIEYVDSATSLVEEREMRAAERALGLPGAQQRKVSYWLSAYGLERQELADLLEELGFILKSDTISMPKGSIRRLNSYLLSTDDTTARKLEQRREVLKIDSRPAASPFEWTAR